MHRASIVNIFRNPNGSGRYQLGFSRHAVMSLPVETVLGYNAQFEAVNVPWDKIG